MSPARRRRLYPRRLYILVVLAASAFPPLSGSDELPPLSSSTTIKGVPAARSAVAISDQMQVFYHIDNAGLEGEKDDIQRQTISGETISVSVYQLDIGATARLTHDRAGSADDEYVVFVGNGAVEITIEGKQTTMTSMSMVAVPVDQSRLPARIEALSKTLVLIYSTFPLGKQKEIHSPGTRTGSTAPIRPAVFANFDNIDWRHKPGSSSLKSVFGHRCTVSLWRTAAEDLPGVYAPGHHHDIEQISYVMQGHGKLRVGDRIRDVAPGSIVLVPANADHGPATSHDGETLVLLDFQPLLRRDLKQRMAQ